MKFYILILIGLLSGCTPTTQYIPSRAIFVENRQNPAFSAFQYINFSETTHRSELKELTGVDPVRTEWCAAFVNAVLNETGMSGSDTVSDYPLTARSFLHWGNKVENPEPGDVVVFPRGNQSWQGHVGFYLKTHIINGVEYYYILGGNQSNKVSIELYPARSALSIRRYSL
jgi:uncharacterized protein (TIGR02594 family)